MKINGETHYRWRAVEHRDPLFHASAPVDCEQVAELPIVRRGRGGRELFRRRSKRKARTRGRGQSGCLWLAGARWEGLHGDRPERQDRNASSHH